MSYAKGEEQVFLGREIAQHRDYSEETARKIDDEINNLVRKSYERAKDVLNDNLNILHKLAELLLEKETIMGRELDKLIYALRPGIRLPSKGSDEQADENHSHTGVLGLAARDFFGDETAYFLKHEKYLIQEVYQIAGFST